MGLILDFASAPSPLGYGTDDCLAAVVDVDVLDRDPLLPLAAVPLQSLDLHRKRPQEFNSEIPALSCCGIVSTPFTRRNRGIAAKFVATIWVASMPSTSSLAPIPLTAARASLIARSVGGLLCPPSQASFSSATSSDPRI